MATILKHITFTGVDAKTDINALSNIQKEFPIVEWGILVSKNWRENGNRYFNPSFLPALERRHLNLSCHLCGSIARAAIRQDWKPLRDWFNRFGFISVFDRCQINVGSEKDNPSCFRYEGEAMNYNEIIIQQPSAHDCGLFLRSKIPNRNRITTLLDASGGKGLDSQIEVLNLPHKIGYAGGISADNFGDKLEYLLSHVSGEFWIDMESGVRTNDWFDLDKVYKILKIYQSIRKDIVRS